MVDWKVIESLANAFCCSNEPCTGGRAPVKNRNMKYLSFLLLLLLTACASDEKRSADSAAESAEMAAEEAAYQNMMDGHDRIMPMMGRITEAQRSITNELSTGGHGEEYRELLLAANEQLEDADDGMMNWMNNTRALDELRREMDHDDIMEYIKEQSSRIARVEADVKGSLANGERILNQEVEHDHDH